MILASLGCHLFPSSQVTATSRHVCARHAKRDDRAEKLFILGFSVKLLVQLHIIGREETLLPPVLTGPPVLVWKFLRSIVSV